MKHVAIFLAFTGCLVVAALLSTTLPGVSLVIVAILVADLLILASEHKWWLRLRRWLARVQLNRLPPYQRMDESEWSAHYRRVKSLQLHIADLTHVIDHD